jgi:NADPH:quinone reductase-like Zn-dependent oxidoreductase
MQSGTKAELDINALLRKRGAIVATTLRARPAAEKAAICAAVVEHVWPLVADGSVRAVVDTTLPLERASEAHALMQSGEHSGKILLTNR